LNHPNIVKFHQYWFDEGFNSNQQQQQQQQIQQQQSTSNKQTSAKQQPPRIILITEYMSSGSLKNFLRKAKKTNQPIKKQTWKRWCIQLLTALHYLHTRETPRIHGDLSCDTIFIQHNGLIKIGSIAPDIVNTHVKTCIDNNWSRNIHHIAPELKDLTNLNEGEQQNSTINTNPYTTAIDIYAFGMVVLEMFNLDLGGNGDTHAVTPEVIKQSIDVLNKEQQDFLNKCLEVDPKKRPSAYKLLFHPLLFEVPKLRLLAAHTFIKNNTNETHGN
jgi:nuclear receptor-binding protein